MSNPIKPPQRVAKLLRRYVVGAALLLILLVAVEWYFLYYIQAGSNEAYAVNLAGRQRMLSQRIAMLTFSVAVGEDGSAPDRQSLREVVDLFERSHQALHHGDEEMGLAAYDIPRLDRAYVAIDQEVKDYIQRTKRVLAGDEISLPQAIALEQKADVLLPKLDRIVGIHESIASAHTRQAQRVLYAAMGTYLLVVLGHLFFVFRPMLRNLVSQIHVLQIYRKIMDDAREGIVITDPREKDNPVVYVNPAFEGMTGYTSAEMIGQNCRILQGEGTDPAVIEKLHAAVAYRKSITTEILNYRKDGEPIWKELSISPVTNDAGRVIRFVSVQGDISSRKAAEERMRNSEMILRLFVENSPAAIAMFDTEVRYLLVSRSWCRDYQIDEQDVIGRSHYEIFPDIPERWKEIHQACLRGETRSCDEDKFIRDDGSVVWLRWDVRPWYKSDDEIGGIIMLTEIITARKEAEQSLRIHRFAVESNADATYWIDREGAITFANQQACGMLGFWLDELKAMTIFDLDVWLTQDYWPSHWDELESKHHVTFETTHRARDGREIPVEVVANYLQFEDVELNCAYARDISQRKIAEEALRISEERLGMALEGSNEGLWDWNIVTGDVYFSPRWYEMLGYADRELPSRIENWMQVTFEEDLPKAQEALEAHFAGKAEYYVCEHRCRCKDGSIVWVLDRGKVVLRDEAGAPQRMVGTHTDITRRREAEAERDHVMALLDSKNHQLEEYATKMEELAEQRAKALVHADRLASIGTLSAGVAHEINNPVSFIAGNLDTLKETWPAVREALRVAAPLPGVDTKEIQFVLDDMPEILAAFEDGVSRITSIVSGLKSFAREDTGEKSACRVKPAVEAALALTHNRLKYNVNVEARYQEDLPLIMANRQQIEQVLVNLFVNAADAMKQLSDGRLEIDVSAHAKAVVITIRDHGTGIPDVVLERMWDPFYTTKEVNEGTGLGLAISRGIIEDHEGTIQAGNAPDGGAIFRIELPLAP